ncbi:recombinase family protein, partial [Mycobacterium tuberculosis]|nr:recombinase family protein [Mycobacterium tuberculosis]
RLDERGELVRGLREIDEEQAEVVRRIFREYAAGASPRAIADRLNAEGIPAPQPRSGSASFWRGSTLYGDRKRKNGILQNQLYIGKLVFNRTRKIVDPKTRKALIRPNPESEWLVEDVPELRIVEDHDWQAVQNVLGMVQTRPPEASRRPKHMLSGIARCGGCGGAWTIIGKERWGCSRNREGGVNACGNNRTITTSQMERRVLSGLQEQMLDPELVEIYVREYHLEHARRSKDLARETERLKKRHREAVDQLEQLPVVALHPTIVADYRAQVAKLNAALAENPEARLEAIPKLRALINSVRLFPRENSPKGVQIEVAGRLNSMLSLATGAETRAQMYGNDGAGEGNCSLPYFLKVAV